MAEGMVLKMKAFGTGEANEISLQKWGVLLQQ